MKASFDPITPPDIECHPELPVIEALKQLLEITDLTLCAHYPEVCQPDWPRYSTNPPPRDAYTVSVILSLAHGLADAIRVYRESIARHLLRNHPGRQPEDDPNPFDSDFDDDDVPI
jgi:hypothetical protein